MLGQNVGASNITVYSYVHILNPIMATFTDCR